MAITLPELRFRLNALEPVISQKTLEFHYGKHHQTYVTNLNNLVKGTPFENADLETIVKQGEGGIFNNAAQVWNHTFYFNQFSADKKNKPEGQLASAIEKSFGSIDGFKEKFNAAAATLFGSGWAWLIRNDDGLLSIVQESNAGNPLRKGQTPILTCDVWEHAYYIDYQNRRVDYISSFWNIIDWAEIEKRYTV
jgi:Fe-Mn family superoxide dismutase